MPMLLNGARFPAMTLNKVGGGTITLPGDLAGSYAVVLAYRGDWCPFCNAQLADFAANTQSLADLGVKVVALSVDDAAQGAAIMDKHHITFPVAFGVDADAFAAQTGAFVNDAPHYLQPTNFVLTPDGSIIASVYASSAIGRLVSGDVMRLVTHVKSRAEA